MNWDTATSVYQFTLFVLAFGIPAWLFFLPPWRLRSWPLVARLPLAILCTQATIYAFFYGCAFPSAMAYAKAHPDYLLDGPLCWHPGIYWLPVTVVASIFLIIKFCFRQNSPRQQ